MDVFNETSFSLLLLFSMLINFKFEFFTFVRNDYFKMDYSMFSIDTYQGQK